MSRARPLLVLLVAALATTVPAAALAQKKDPTNVPAGVTAGGVDLSGLTLVDAQARLEATVGPKVNADLILGAAGKPWTLKAVDAKLTFDALTTAKRAIRAKARGRRRPQAQPFAPRGPYLGRRRGGQGRQAGQGREGQDHAASTSTAPAPSTAAALDQKAVAAQVDAALDDGVTAPRTLHTALKKTSPAVNVNDLKQVYGTIITVDKAHFKLRLYKGLKFKKSYGVAVGQPAYPTPTGLFHIANKQVDPVWSVPN